MCGRFALYAEPAEVARFLPAAIPGGVKWLNCGLEGLAELEGQLKPAEGHPGAGSPNDGAYLLELNCE